MKTSLTIFMLLATAGFLSSCANNSLNTALRPIRQGTLIEKATVVFLPRLPEFNSMHVQEANLMEREKSMKEIGCTYATRDRSRIDDLVDILNKSDIKENDDQYRWQIRGRQGIFLNFSDGSELHFLFSTGMPAPTYNGVLIRTDAGRKIVITVTAQPLWEKLAAWAVATGPNSNPQSPLVKAIMNCDANIR